jgi:outer membrane protein assembly complex protein YaeT
LYSGFAELPCGPGSPAGRRRRGTAGRGFVLVLLAIALDALAAAPTVELIFRGNAEKSAAALREAAAGELADFESRGQRRSDIDDAAHQMELAYQRDGYAFVRVGYAIERAGDLTTVAFNITEGPRVLVREIRITGNEAIELETLRAFFQPESPGLLPQVQRPFVRSEMDSAVAAMQDYYRGRGYLDAVVERPVYEFTADRRQVDLAVQVREGVPYRVERMEFQGDVPADARQGLDELRAAFIDQPYTSRSRLVARARAAEILGGQGFPDASVAAEARMESAPGAVTLLLDVAPGPRVTIAGIEVRGNQRTRAEFIRERIRLKPGERYHRLLEKESFDALYAAGIFSKVEIQLEKTADEERRILVVTVAELPSQEVFIEPGYGSYEQLRLVVGYRLKNLFGTGRSWSSEALGAVKAQAVSSTLTDPWFFGSDVRADLTGLVRRREEPSFTRRDAGGTFLLSKELSRGLTVASGLTFRRTDLSDSAAAVEEEDLRDDYNFASIKAQATYDTRNDIFFPTTGQRTFGAVERADTRLGGDVTFLRLTGGTRLFRPLARSTVLGLRYSTGLIIPGEEEFTVPLAERFFNGGENTVRSFKESKLGPRDSNGDPAGGLAYNVLSAELRQRLIGDLTGTLFVDWGNVAPNRTRESEGQPPYRNRSQILSDTLGDFLRGFRPGVGLGLQYLLPVGPARVDFAFNPDRDEARNEDAFVMHFSVGMAF